MASSEDIFANITVDHEKPSPFHVQIYEALDYLIQESKLSVGMQLPGEQKLSTIFGVSRPVVRQALNQLERDGRIIRVMGKGTFVAEPKIREGLVGSLHGFFEDMTRQGYTLLSRTLKQESIPAKTKIARNLQVEEDTAVIELTRLRFVNSEPILLVTTYLPEAICASVLDVDFTHQSLYEHLEQVCDLRIATGTRSIEAVLATEDEAELLEIQTGAPLILIESVSYLEDGTPIEYYHAVHRSDRTRFEVNLIRSAEQH